MNRPRFKAIALGSFALVIALSPPWRAWAQDTKIPYPAMAPLEQYLMDPNAEIALARSAAPDAISRDAKVLVLGSHGYETAAEGKNGFVCLVTRSWMNTFENPEYWNPKNRTALCYNPPAARSVLPIDSMRTKLVLAGKSKAEIRERVKAGLAKRNCPSWNQERCAS